MRKVVNWRNQDTVCPPISTPTHSVEQGAFASGCHPQLVVGISLFRVFKMEFHVAQTGLELVIIPLSQPPEC